MAEAIAVIGAAAAVTQLLHYAQRARGYFSDVVDGTQTLDELTSQINDMSVILTWIEKSARENQVHAIIQRCSKKLTKLVEMVEKLRAVRSEGVGGRVRMFGMWARKERDITKLMDSIFDIEFNLLKMFYLLKDNRTGGIQHVETMKQPMVSSTLPARNPRFVGLGDALSHIRRRMDQAYSHTRLAIVGLGGSGKSQLAIEFAYRFRQDFPKLLVLFMRASSELEAEFSYLETARRANIISESDPANASPTARDVKSFLDAKTSGRWLLIVDGADAAGTFFGPKNIFEQLPQGSKGFIVFTSRNRDLAFELIAHDPANLICLGPLAESDAIQLLTTISNDTKTDTDHKAELVKELECLPLAIVQAAKFIQRKPIDTYDYLKLYRLDDNEKSRLLDFEGSLKDSGSTEAVLRTWLISFNQIQKDSNFAAELFSFIACLHFHAVPYSLLRARGDSFVDVISALGLLEAYSMIRADQANSAVDMHSLVHFVLKHRLKSTREFTKFANQAFEIISQAFPSSFKGKDELSLGKQLILHAQVALDNATSYGTEHLQLTSQVSLYLHVTGNFASSLRFAELSVERSKALTGDDSSRTLEALRELALVHQSLGNYQTCQSITERVLACQKQTLHDDHPDVLASLNNLGLILQKRGEYKRAEEIHRDCLEAKERVLGPEDDSTIKSLNNLALALQDQENYEAAEKCFQRAANVRQALYGKVHTGTLLSLNNLAVALQLQGKFAEAGSIYSDVFHTRQELLGPKHHATLRSKGNMALNILQQGDYDNAEAMTREVLESLIETLGENHPETLTTRVNLANALYRQGNLRDTERLYKEVFEARKVLLGENHPTTISCGKIAVEVRAELETQRAHQKTQVPGADVD